MLVDSEPGFQPTGNQPTKLRRSSSDIVQGPVLLGEKKLALWFTSSLGTSTVEVPQTCG